MNDLQKITTETYSKQSAQFIRTYYNNSMEPDLADFLRFIDTIKGRKILDAGCGPGAHSLYFHERNYEVTGIDVVEPFLQHARTICPGATFINMDLRKIIFPDKHFDGIWSCASLLHIPKKELTEVLTQFKRILKNSGMLYVSVKQGQGEKIENGRFFSYHTLSDLENFLNDTGFNPLIKYVEEKTTGTWVTFYASSKTAHL